MACWCEFNQEQLLGIKVKGMTSYGIDGNEIILSYFPRGNGRDFVWMAGVFNLLRNIWYVWLFGRGIRWDRFLRWWLSFIEGHRANLLMIMFPDKKSDLFYIQTSFGKDFWYVPDHWSNNMELHDTSFNTVIKGTIEWQHSCVNINITG